MTDASGTYARYHHLHKALAREVAGNTSTDRALDEVAGYLKAKRIVEEAVRLGVPVAALRLAVADRTDRNG